MQATDSIVYTDPFKENVQGRLMAQFRLDSVGKPKYERHPDDRRLRVYTIDVYLKTTRAQEIKAVHYYMDDPSYIDPEGYSDQADNEFREEITSYGDVEIVVTVEMSKHKYEQRAWLSNMLENGHADDTTLAIQNAIDRIKVN